MLVPDPGAAIRRRTNRLNALTRIADIVGCGLCGETRPFALHSREGHHVAGRKNQDVTVNICLNCHAATHEAMRSLGVRLTYEGSPSQFDRLIALLASLGQLLETVGRTLVEWALWLTEVGPSLEMSSITAPDWTPGVTS